MLVHQIVTSGIGAGMGDEDFGKMLELQAATSGMTLESEYIRVATGLEPDGSTTESPT